MNNGNGFYKVNEQQYQSYQVVDKLRPNNIEAEEAVLGSLLIDRDKLIDVSLLLKPVDFFIERNGWIYQAMLLLQEAKMPIDCLTLADQLERGGKLNDIGGSGYLTHLMTVTPTSIHAEYYARIVKEASVRRRLIDVSGKIAELAYDESNGDPSSILSEAEGFLLDILDNSSNSEVNSAGEVTNRVFSRLERVCQQKGITGIPTSLIDLDRLLGGLQDSDMVVIAGRPGMGKTALALQIAKNAAQNHHKRALIFSLEMSDEQLIQRLVSAESGIDTQRLRLGKIKEDEWPGLLQATKTIAGLPIHISDNSMLTPGLLRSIALRHHARHGIDLIIIDYLQLMRTDKGQRENKNQEVSDISRACKTLARELNVPVVVLSQLSRALESRSDKHPILSDLRDSGSIEQDADVVLFIYRDDVYNPDTQFVNIAELIVSKHRNGPTGMLSAFWKGNLATFVNLEVRTTPLYQVK